MGQQPGALVVRVQKVGADGQDATGPENIGRKSGRNLDPEKTPFSRKTLEVSLDYAPGFLGWGGVLFAVHLSKRHFSQCYAKYFN